MKNSKNNKVKKCCDLPKIPHFYMELNEHLSIYNK